MIEQDVSKYIYEQIENTIITNHLLKDGDRIVVAVSGGPDSMCLLSSLFELKHHFKEQHNINYELLVAHVNHMIRKESYDEKEYVENFCKQKNIPFYYLKENVPELSKKLKMSEETCGRKVRYDFFEKIRQETNSTIIATAHNLNDDAETILLNIMRGTGLNGLTGMDYQYKNIIRPLLNIKKIDINLYNESLNLNPCIDKTNFENNYIRNKIRNVLIPEIETEYNSNIVGNLIRMKKLLKNDENFLKEYTQKVLKTCIIDNTIDSIKFKISFITKEMESIACRLIREIINLKVGNLEGIENIHIQDVLTLLKHHIKGKKYCIGNKFTIEILGKDIVMIY
ncbi:MAG: tRNA lysidine(34) synthetase TilS [Clostridia bacterium]|nr:tRNA lysidine(34) synthetase TilS [Clostridia bacterium]